MITDKSTFCISASSCLREAVECIDRNRAKIALVVTKDYKLLDTVTDGDIRRALLAGDGLEAPVDTIRKRKASSSFPQPISARDGQSPSDLLSFMRDKDVSKVPIVDQNNSVVGLVTVQELVQHSKTMPLQAVVMAGGLGTRLMPLTKNIPKPMLPVGDRPLLERTIDQLREAGVSRVNVATHYKSDVIEDHFGDGSEFGVDLRYVNEDEPLGTAGALGLLNIKDQPILVINGDIVTGVDFKALLEYHAEHEADMTVGVRQYEFRVPYGVIEMDDLRIRSIKEKPVIRQFINAGIYVLSPVACDIIPNGERYDMSDLIDTLIMKGRRVISFPIHEYWLDIGQLENYERARIEFREGRGSNGLEEPESVGDRGGRLHREPSDRAAD